MVGGYHIAAPISFVRSIIPESLNMPHSSPPEHALHTEVPGTIQVGLLDNLGEYNTKIASHSSAHDNVLSSDNFWLIMPRDRSYPYTCGKISGQKLSAVAFETNDIPPKKRGVTVEIV